MTTLAIIVAYIAIGAFVARLATPSIIRRNTYRKGDRMKISSREYMTEPGYHHRNDGVYRTLVVRDFWLMILLWPVMFWIITISGSLNKEIDKVDPQVHAKQAARIEELERELDL